MTMDKVEKYINDYARNCSNELCSIQDRYGKKIISYHEWLTPNNAREVAEIAKKDVIDKACEWLLKNDSYAKPTEVLVRDFRKAMEE